MTSVDSRAKSGQSRTKRELTQQVFFFVFYQAAAGILALLQLVLVALWATRPRYGSGQVGSGPASRVNILSLAASCVSCASTLMMCAISYAEHGKSLRPSSLLNVFLLVSLLLDAAVLRTLWLSPYVDGAVQGVFTASFATKATLLLLEAREKSSYLLNRGAPAPEETSGLYSRAVFGWVTPLLRAGFKRLLRPDDMFNLDEQMQTAVLGERFWKYWKKSESRVFPTHLYIFVVNCPLDFRWPGTLLTPKPANSLSKPRRLAAHGANTISSSHVFSL